MNVINVNEGPKMEYSVSKNKKENIIDALRDDLI